MSAAAAAVSSPSSGRARYRHDITNEPGMTFVLVWVNQLAGLATFYGGGDRREMFTFRPMGLRHRAQDGAAQ